MTRIFKIPKQREAVEDSCGCVFCDLDLKPEPYVVGGVNMGDHHPNKHGRVIPCTRQP